MKQSNIQTLTYWQKKFSVDQRDVEIAHARISATGQIVSLSEIAIDVIQRRIDAEKVQEVSETTDAQLYRPKDTYNVGAQLSFPMLSSSTGVVESLREATHPQHGPFVAMTVYFAQTKQRREYASQLQADHALNNDPQQSGGASGRATAEEIYKAFQAPIRSKLVAALAESPDIAEFKQSYYLTSMLPEFHEGLYNIADAAIDINNGPLSTDALIEQMGLLGNAQEVSDTLRFSLNYRLTNDARFHDVGTVEQPAWYLQRLTPEALQTLPERLVDIGDTSYDVGALDDTLLTFLSEIDDEGTHPDDISQVGTDIKDITLVLNFPHRTAGTLPLTPKTEAFFPRNLSHPVHFEFVDGQTGDTFPGWSVASKGYVSGLEAWYENNGVIVGAYIKIKRSKNANQVIIDIDRTRAQRDWLRMALVTDHRLSFQMSKELVACQYDELMAVGVRSQEELDKVWQQTKSRNTSLFDLLCQLFPELSKLNPQSNVHAKTLYSAINVIRKTPPGVLFQELVSHDCFVAVDHGYWIYDPNLRD